ncbi:MAG: leucine-rich repeat protein [Bacteroidales bacterium]|nr:leucine-rich repeat protein [Bacteroidales bacterium]
MMALSVLAVLAFAQGARCQSYDFYTSQGGTLLYYAVSGNSEVTVVPPLYPNSNWSVDSGSTWQGYDKPIGFVQIPQTVQWNGQNYLVTAVADYAFFRCDSLTGVQIPVTVRSIGEWAFARCTRLSRFAIQNPNLRSISRGCFAYDSSLTNPGLNQTITSIDSYAFYGCIRLWSINFPSSLEHIGYKAFAECGVRSMDRFPSSLVSIGDSAFANDNMLLSNIDISAPFCRLGVGAFANCSSISLVKLPGTLDTIADNAFANCVSLENLTIGEGTRVIGNNAFLNCLSLYTCNLPSTLISIGDSAFRNASRIGSDLSLPEGLVSIGEYAFSKCSGLERTTLPSTMRYVASGVFADCGMLRAVTFSEGVDSIASGAFRNCPNLVLIVPPSTLKVVGSYAFCNDNALQTISLPDSVATIGNGVFKDCHNLSAINMPEAIDSIGSEALSNCNSIRSVEFPDSMERLGDAVLAGCDNLTYCHLPWRMKRVGSRFFYNTNLRSVMLPPRVAYVGDKAFSYCRSLHKVTFSDSLTAMGDSLFLNSLLVDTLVLRCSVPPAIGDNTFTSYTATVVVPCGADATYKAHPIWRRFQHIVPNCNSLGNSADDNIRVYALGGRVVVEGADSEPLSLFDMTGRLVPNRSLRTGVYLAKVGCRPAMKVVVMQ